MTTLHLTLESRDGRTPVAFDVSDFVIAGWAIASGVLEIAAAVRLRRQIEGEWILGAIGVLSIAFGVWMIARPGEGALALVFVIGAYAILVGALLIGLGLVLRRDHERGLPSDLFGEVR